MKTPTKITKISEEPKIFLERFWDNNIPKFSGYYIEMPRELVNEPIGTEIWLNGYETGRIPNRPADKIVKEMGHSSKNAGYRDGLAIWYYKNGNINKKMMYKEGILKGLVEDFWETGKRPNRPLDKVVMGNDPENQAGYREGMSIWYYENGNIERKMMHKEGVPNGLVEIFWENGKIREKGNNGGPPEPGYSVGNGRRVGLWEIFDEEGNKIEEKWFPDKWDENKQPIN